MEMDLWREMPEGLPMLHLFVMRDGHLKAVVNPFSCFPMPYHSYLVQTILTIPPALFAFQSVAMRVKC